MDRPALCSSQMDSLGTVLSIHGGLYTFLLFVHMWLNQQVISKQVVSASMARALSDVILQSMTS